MSEAARQPPPQPPVQHINVVVAAPSPPYVADSTPPPAAFYDQPAPFYGGCNPSWFGCGGWWNSGFYPASVVVAAPPRFGRDHPVRGGRPVSAHGLRPVVPPRGGVGPIPSHPAAVLVAHAPGPDGVKPRSASSFSTPV